MFAYKDSVNVFLYPFHPFGSGNIGIPSLRRTLLYLWSIKVARGRSPALAWREAARLRNEQTLQMFDLTDLKRLYKCRI